MNEILIAQVTRSLGLIPDDYDGVLSFYRPREKSYGALHERGKRPNRPVEQRTHHKKRSNLFRTPPVTH
jgi:hypothetical protein